MTGSAYQAQLVAQLRAAEDELAALRPLRRQLADAQAGQDAARATSRRLNARTQQAESRLAAIGRAVRDWQIGDQGTYVPLRSLAAIAKAVGTVIPDGRFELHYQRVERLQVGAIEREALLADARDLLEPWGGRGDGWPSIAPAIGTLIEKLNDALARATTAEAERDQFAAGLPLVCSDGRHEAKIRGLEQLLTAGQKATEHWEGAYTREVSAHGKTEGAVSRVRAECERIVAEVYGQHDEDDNGMREAVRRITAAIDGEVCHCSLLNGCDCGMPATTEVVRGGRRLRHSAATRNVIKPSDHDGGTDNVITLPPQPVRPGPMHFQPCTTPATAPELTARYIPAALPACPSGRHRFHSGTTCDEYEAATAAVQAFMDHAYDQQPEARP